MPGHSKGNRPSASGVGEGELTAGAKPKLCGGVCPAPGLPEDLRRRPVGPSKLHDCRGPDGYL
jgi:hypothetical protein